MDNFFICIGYILLPFVTIIKLIKNGTKDMSDIQTFLFYFFLLIVILQVVDLFSYL